MHDSRTIADAKAHLRANATEGTGCPCCGQFVKIYRRTVNRGMAVNLWALAEATRDERRPLRFRDLAGRFGVSSIEKEIYRGDYAKLRYWDLIREDEETPQHWHVTREGRDFLRGYTSVQQYKYVLFGKVVTPETFGLDVGTPISYADALGTQFTLPDIMLYSTLLNPGTPSRP